MVFEVISINDTRWDDIVFSSCLFDFYHTSYNHKLDSEFDLKLFYLSDGKDFIAMPFVIRPIEGSELFDATSVYGYSGPISSKCSYSFSNTEFVPLFQKSVSEYFNNNRIIAAFSRLHPLIDSSLLFSDWGEIVHLNKTVTIDLRLTIEEQRKQYRKSNKSEINQLRRKGFYVEVVTSDVEIDNFIRIYYETMDRVGASPYYYFSRAYFYSFLRNNFFRSFLLVAKFEGQTVAGAIFTYASQIMQYHLAGTGLDYIKDTPMKLVLDEARILANDLGLSFFHLGGGVNGKIDDSLFRFKSGFSSNYSQFSVWKYIVNRAEYYSLVEQRGKTNSGSSFFPLYRA